MSDLSSPSTPVSSTPPISPLLVIGGVLFILIWGAACLLMMSMSLFGVLMANDSGAASTDEHGGLILGVLLSQILITAAGLPAGLAFFWRRQRRLLLIFFTLLFILGAVGLVVSVMSFSPGGSPA